MWIEREMGKSITLAAAKRPALVLTGCRQSGKTSLLTRKFPEHRYVTLDLPLTAEEAEGAGDSFLERNPPPLIVDEVQYAPMFLRYIKANIDAHRKETGRFLITGSQRFPLMKGVGESLAGRAAVFELHSLSAGEIQAHTGKIFDEEGVTAAILRGGYPEVWARDLSPLRFYGDYVATYLERDVRSVLGVRNLRDFHRFLRLCAVRTGQLVSYNSIAVDLGVSSNTVKSWLSILEASGIVSFLEPYFENLGKRIIKTPKLYFMDTGLACFLVGIQTKSDLLSSPLLGPLFETHVHGQIVRHFANRGVRAPLYFYRDQYAREVDFLIDKGRRFKLIEAKWNRNFSSIPRGFRELTRMVGPARILSQTVVVPAGPETKKKTGITVTNSVDMDFLDFPDKE